MATTKTPPAATRKKPTTKPAAPASSRIAIGAGTLKRIISAVAIAASDDEYRPILTGVLVEFTDDGNTRWTATDSYRLNTITRRHSFDVCTFGRHRSAIIPAEWLNRWRRTPTGPDSSAVLTWDADRATIECDGETASTPLIPGSFPQFDPILEGRTISDQQAQFNPRLLADVFKASTKWSVGDAARPISTVAFDPVKASIFETVTGEGTLTSVLMPVRVG